MDVGQGSCGHTTMAFDVNLPGLRGSSDDAQIANACGTGLTPPVYSPIAAYILRPTRLQNGNGFKLNNSANEGAVVPAKLDCAPHLQRLPRTYQDACNYDTTDIDSMNDCDIPAASTPRPRSTSQSGRIVNRAPFPVVLRVSKCCRRNRYHLDARTTIQGSF